MAGFTRATKHAAKLRMALAGPSGSGKTYSALAIATALAEGQPVAVVDTEHGSASKYADLFEFDVLELESFHPQKYIDAIRDAESGGYGVIVFDSLSHAWSGKGGALELKDEATKRSRSGNSFDAWREVTPVQNALIEAIVAAKIHVIATMRSKTEYVLETDERGKQKPRKIGLAPVQRDGMEYEFDVFGEMDQGNSLIVSKSRCPALSEAVIAKPGAQVAKVLREWLSGEPAPPRAPAVQQSADSAATDQAQYVCAHNECGKPITAVAIDSKKATAEKWAELTTKEFGAPYCLEHARAKREAANAK